MSVRPKFTQVHCLYCKIPFPDEYDGYKCQSCPTETYKGQKTAFQLGYEMAPYFTKDMEKRFYANGIELTHENIAKYREGCRKAQIAKDLNRLNQ